VNKKTREQVRATNVAYQRATDALIDSGIYDTSDDFTVVRQPFMEHMKVPATVSVVSDEECLWIQAMFSRFSRIVWLIFRTFHPIASTSARKATKQLLSSFGTTW
jgi:hypothetical protein